MTAQMPEEIRHHVRSKQHPARAVDCPHCGAHAHRPCTNQRRTAVLAEPHWARVSAWIAGIAVCPACQVECGIPCHDDGQPLPDHGVHAEREREALVTT